MSSMQSTMLMALRTDSYSRAKEMIEVLKAFVLQNNLDRECGRCAPCLSAPFSQCLLKITEFRWGDLRRRGNGQSY